VTAIASIGRTPDAVRLVRQTLKDTDSKVRQTSAAAKALRDLGDKSGALLGPFNLGSVASEGAFKDGSATRRTLASALLAEDCDRLQGPTGTTSTGR
jgi:hypothetical protein